MPNFSLRDVLNALRSLVGALELAAGSLLAWLTIVAWHRRSTPLESLAELVRWFGPNFADPLARADSWLNAAHRHSVFAASCAVLFACVALAEVFAAARPSIGLKEFVAVGLRSWTTYWTLAALLTQLDVWSIGWAIIAGIALVATRLLILRAFVQDLGLLAVPLSLLLLFACLIAIPLWLPGHAVVRLAVPGVRGAYTLCD